MKLEKNLKSNVNLIAIIYYMTKYVTYANSNKKLINFFNYIKSQKKKITLEKIVSIYIDQRNYFFIVKKS